MYKTALVLASIGALNWGFVALFNFNLVSFLFGVDTILTNAVYLIVAAAAIVAVSMGLVTSGATKSQGTQYRDPAYSAK